MFNVADYTYSSSVELKEHFNRYCNECWRTGFGNCRICEKRKNKELLKYKLREFKQI